MGDVARPEPIEALARGGTTELATGTVDPFTAMTARFGWPARSFGGRFFAGFALADPDRERLLDLERRGAVVYVMRYSSRLDYFLFNWLFLSAGVRLSSFANGIRFYYYRPVGEALRLLARGAMLRLRRGSKGMRQRGFDHTRSVVREGGTLFLFLRTDKLRSQLFSRPRAVKSALREIDYLREVVETTFGSDVHVSLVPLALFWRKSGGQRSRFLNVFYGAPTRPSDTGKVLSFLWNYRNLAVRVGEAIDLSSFVAERGGEGFARVTKQVRRSLLIFLRREEKPVLGAALRPLDRIAEAVLADPEVVDAMAEADASRRRFAARAETRARRYLREIAANPSPTALAILDVVVAWMFRRLFARFEVTGLDGIVAAAKRSPLVLVPSHRSHFDYVILSWLFYESHLVPPLVAAGINLAFWPLGPIFRRGGAFFLRRSFEGNRLYSTVFRAYVQALIKDGVTQEFFIEGTRSRTGKTLQPRLGMLSMVLDAFANGVRRDVQIVPVGFTYERLVEEGSMTEERKGASKVAENLPALLKAGRVFRSNFGAVTVRFGEPMSLAGLVDLERYKKDPELRRRTIESLADELSRRINGLITAGRSSVSAAALLGSGSRALRETDFCTRVSEVVALLELLGVSCSQNLERNLAEGHPEAAVELLLQSGAVERRESSEGAILQLSEGARERLAYYRATISPALAWPATLALALTRHEQGEAVLAEASGWLDLLRLEFFPPDPAQRPAVFDKLMAHFREQGWIEGGEGDALVITPQGAPRIAFFAAQIRPLLDAYRALLRAVAEAELPADRGSLLGRAKVVLEEELLLGDAAYTEAVCPTTLGNAFQLLIAEGVLSVEGNPRRDDARVSSGPDWVRLGELRARLAHAFRSG